jgi:hypothetical protein
LIRRRRFSRATSCCPKVSEFGFHYGTGVTGGNVAHTMPGIGKHVGTLDEFGDCKPVTIIRPQRSPIQNYLVEQAALSDLGKPYDEWAANCEHDVHRVHTGKAQSPPVNGIKFLGGVALVIGLIKAFSDD